MPHGPANAVFVAAPIHIHGPSGSTGGGGITSPSGCPAYLIEISGSGPIDPILNGVWQLSHPLVEARYFPRATGSDGSGGWQPAVVKIKTIPAPARILFAVLDRPVVHFFFLQWFVNEVRRMIAKIDEKIRQGATYSFLTQEIL
jgi:hypothetical protein